MEPNLRLMSKKVIPQEEEKDDITLRPKKLEDYIGQEKLKENLKVFIEAAKERKEALDHILLCGPPGLGKTTLAYIISKELGVNIKTTSGPAIERPGDLAAILTDLDERDVLFIDEIHRINKTIEEILYPAMEDFHLDIIIGQGPSARTMKLPLKKFTLVGATTRVGLLTSPLRNRFGFTARLDFYNVSELCSIIERSAKVLKIEITKEGAYEIARRSRGTPRIANRLLKRVRDFAQVEYEGKIDLKIADHALEMLDIDKEGFDKMDRSILLTIIEKFNGGPVGIETIAAAIGEEKDTIIDVYEPYLIQVGYLNKTSRGRVVTPVAYKYFGKKANPEKGLFDDLN